jgi:cytochrome P450
MVTTEEPDVSTLPLVPANPLPFTRKLAEVQKTHSCQVTFRESGGQVTRVTLGPKWLGPPIVFVMSPAGARDVLSRKDDACDRTPVHREMRLLMGDNLADLPNEPWVARKRTLQPLFTKQYVRRHGEHMAAAAAMIARGWREGAEVDLDAASRRLTMRALGRSVLGTDLDESANAVAEPLKFALSYVLERGSRPVNPPRWLPLPKRRRAIEAYSTMHRLAEDILAACRADPSRDAPLVHALIGATDPETGRRLSDDDICNDLIAFIVAGHDTTATTIAYALWELGRHPEVQDRVAAEAAALGDRALEPDDVARLPYTVQVVHEALRLCPPVPVAGRTAMQDIAVDGFRVEAASIVLVGIFGMHRDQALWDDALAFDPDRFGAANFATLNRWQFIPFGAGTRSCIGDHFAMLELVLALGTIVRDVEIRSRADEFPLAVPFTVVADGPIMASVRARR